MPQSATLPSGPGLACPTKAEFCGRWFLLYHGALLKCYVFFFVNAKRTIRGREGVNSRNSRKY